MARPEGTGRPPVGGIVLTGGRSTRMGSPKEWLDFAGVPLLRRVVEVVASKASPVAVVRSRGQPLPALPQGVIVTEDEVEGCGPLAGFAAGLAALQDACEVVYLSSCDLPLLRPSFLQMVIDSMGEADIAVPWIEGRYHPLAAAYRMGLLPVARRLLAAGQHRMLLLFPEARVRVLCAGELRAADPAFLSLRNCNTTDDYRALLALLDNQRAEIA